jgi:hypothetical protein
MSDGQYTITLDHERGLVHVIAQGEFDRDLGDEMITTARKKAAEYHYHILCDARQSKAKVAFSDWFLLPRRLAVYRNVKTRYIKTAIVVTTGKQEKVYRFFEIVTRNLGMNIRIFFREEDALEWLSSKQMILKEKR